LRRALLKQMGNMALSIGREFPPGTRVSSPQSGYVLRVELAVGNS
jgi:hypothetical protein